MSRVALVFPYFRTRAATEMLFPPLGLAALVAQLRALGIEAKAFDCTFATLEQLRGGLISYGPDVIGVSAMVSLTRNALRVAETVRADLPDALLVAGGPLPTVFPRRFSERFDAVFRGEADLSFPHFCRDLFGLGQRAAAETMGALPLDTYRGLFVPNHGLTVDNATVHHSQAELATFPLPDRSDFDHAAYQEAWLGATGERVTSIILTLGCPYGCDFCSKPVFGSVVRRRSLDAVFEEIEQLRGLGYESLWIADDTFTLDGAYLREFCRRMTERHSQGRGMTWSCLSRVDGLDVATVGMMREAGCTRVHLGLESGSQATLALMSKRATVEEGISAVRLFAAAGIEVSGFFIVGYPGETESSIEETFALALSLPLAEISFNVPYPLPGSSLFDRLGGPDEGRDWEEENEVTFLYRSEIDEGWLRGRIAETMTAFAEKRRAGASARS